MGMHLNFRHITSAANVASMTQVLNSHLGCGWVLLTGTTVGQVFLQ